MEEKMRVLVTGCNGRMGQLVCDAVNSSEDMYVFFGVDRETSKCNNKFPVQNECNYNSFSNWKTKGTLPDLMIDFSAPELSLRAASNAAMFGIPIVVATTGFTPEDIEDLKGYAEKTKVFWSSNMSVDVTIFKNAVQTIARQIPDADVEIVETHHNRKSDAPSGTAKMLAHAINEALGNSKTIVYGREGKRRANEIGISSLRGGNITGEHTVKFFSEFETLEVKHTSYSPAIFAEGALQAGRFILAKEEENGFYTMDDMLSMLSEM